MGVRSDFTQNYASTAAGMRGNVADLADKTRLYRIAKAKGLTAAAFFDAPKRKTTKDPGAGTLVPKK